MNNKQKVDCVWLSSWITPTLLLQLYLYFSYLTFIVSSLLVKAEDLLHLHIYIPSSGPFLVCFLLHGLGVISTPLIAEAWQRMCLAVQGRVLELGTMPPNLNCKKNMRSAYEHPDIIDKQLLKEIRLDPFGGWVVPHSGFVSPKG
jgi:hypothetical protein